MSWVDHDPSAWPQGNQRGPVQVGLVEVELGNGGKNVLFASEVVWSDRKSDNFNVRRFRRIIPATLMDGAEMKRIRKALKMTQADFGDALGLHGPFWVGKMERGQAPIEKRTALAVRYLEIALA